MAPQFLSPHEPTHWPLGSYAPHLMGLTPLQQVETGLPLQLGIGRKIEVTSSEIAPDRIQRLRETKENIHKLIVSCV